MFMRGLLLGGVFFILSSSGLEAGEKRSTKVPAVLNFKVTSIDGQPVELAKYQGKVVLVVNVASECGYTGQYKGLQALHAKYAKDGLAILGFPCNDFGKQEPDDNAKIKEFCTKNYQVQFDMFAKVDILGAKPAPLFKHLTSEAANPRHAGQVKWNFEKFLIGRDGTIVARFLSDVEPDSEEFQKALQAELAKK
jgi:glutathione peroxidase